MLCNYLFVGDGSQQQDIEKFRSILFARDLEIETFKAGQSARFEINESFQLIFLKFIHISLHK